MMVLAMTPLHTGLAAGLSPYSDAYAQKIDSESQEIRSQYCAGKKKGYTSGTAMMHGIVNHEELRKNRR